MPLPVEFAVVPRLYHFTDSRNVAAIRNAGGLFATVHLHANVELYPGGNQLSRELDSRQGMDRYVHLCFLSKHPMQYLASQDGRIQSTTWIKVNREVMALPGVMFCSKVSNANDALPIPLVDAAALIDFEALYQYLDWRQPELYARRSAAERFEVLVPDFIPVEYLEF